MENESKIFGVSGRGWLAFFIIITVCVMSLWSIKIMEPMNSIALLTVGFYFGQKGK